MKRLTQRRSILLCVAALAVATQVDAGTARDMETEVTIEFEEGQPIPEGRLEVYLEGPAPQDAVSTHAAFPDVASDGKTRRIGLSLDLPQRAASAAPTQIAARLERGDGWLLARGSAQIESGAPVVITLYTVMY